MHIFYVAIKWNVSYIFLPLPTLIYSSLLECKRSLHFYALQTFNLFLLNQQELDDGTFWETALDYVQLWNYNFILTIYNVPRALLSIIPLIVRTEQLSEISIYYAQFMDVQTETLRNNYICSNPHSWWAWGMMPI